MQPENPDPYQSNPEQNPQQAPPAQPQPSNPVSPSNPAYPVTQQVVNPLAAMQPGEQVVCSIKRHPIGLVSTYFISGTVLLLAAVGAFIFVPRTVTGSYHNEAIQWAAAGFVFLAIFVALFTYIAAKVYQGNSWIVTDDSITQLQQISLFNRQSSQLSLHNLEDITVDQNGLIQSAFNFGTLHAETAGERSKFAFMYCPDPNGYARRILMAREKFMGGGAYEGKAANNASDTNNELPPHDQGPSDDPGVNLNV